MTFETITATFKVPQRIIEGLNSGEFERVGGVIQQTGSKQVVAWLRESGNVDLNTVPQFSVLNLTATASLLNLGVSVMGFSVVLAKLNQIEHRLETIQVKLAKINRKLDLSFYANFRAALSLAEMAFMADQIGNRKSLAVDAINRFLEAEHVYTGLVDIELEQRSQIAEEYLGTLALAYIAEIQCHLELGEYKLAAHRFNEAKRVIRSRSEAYVNILLTPHPSVYLHPRHADKIGLRDLTSVYRWLIPQSDETTVFEKLRDEFYHFRTNYGKWVQTLPPAIVASHEVQGYIWGNFNEMYEEALKRLPDVFHRIQQVIETEQRFETYQSEIEAIAQLEMSFADWKSLAPVTEPEIEVSEFMLLIPEKRSPVQVAA